MGICQTNVNLVSVKFNADTSAGGFNNISVNSSYFATENYTMPYLQRGLKRYELTNHLGNVLTVISDKKMMKCPSQDTIVAENFSGTPFIYGQWYDRNSWGRGNSSLNQSGGVLTVIDSITSDPHARLNYMTPYDLQPNHTFRVKVDLTNNHGSDPWYADIFYSETENGYAGTFMRVDSIFAGSNNFTFNVPGYAWRIRFLHHAVAEDIEYSFDNFSIVDITEGETPYYIADIVSATDYSPYGAPLPGRTYNVQETQNKTTIANQAFTSGTDSWAATGTNTTVSNSSGRLALTTTNTTTVVSMSRNYTVNTTKHYRLNIDVDAGSVTSASYSIIGVSTLATGNFTGASHQQIDFIADGGTITIKVQMGIGSGTRVVYIDNVKLEEITGDLSGYRFAFNGQEKDDEVSGIGNIMTAEFWEYDARLGRRWNIDPKPDFSISPFSAFANNPIVFTDHNGDTTYVYNTLGQYAYTIYDRLNSNEIVFLTESRAKFLLLNKSYSIDQKAEIARKPNYAFARITENTLKELSAIKMYTGINEKGGVLYVDKKTKEIHLWECKTCKSESISADAAGGMRLSNAKISEEELGGSIIGYWHQHNLQILKPGSYHESKPTDNNWADFGEGGNWPSIHNGGIGLIVTRAYITVYPLMDLNKGTVPSISAFGLGTTSVLKPNYSKGYTGGMTESQYGTFRRSGSGHNNKWSR